MEEQSRRVLIVDDDASLRGLLAATLRRRGLIVDEAADGGQAIALAAANRYSVMLLDLLMPGVDGIEVLERIAGDEVPAPPVVIVMTGADRATIQRAGAHRIHGIVRKPLDAEELASVVLACADIRDRNSFSAMAIATVLAGSPLLTLLKM